MRDMQKQIIYITQLIKEIMKRGIYLLVFILTISLIGVSAVSSNIRGSYKPAETVVVELSGSILEPIAFENVMIKRNNIEIATDYDVKKLGEKYYIWFTAPKEANNYTLLIKNLKTLVNGIPQTIDFSQNFTVSGNLIDYSIIPGFIMAMNNFQMNAKVYGDNDIPIDIDFPYQRQVLLKPGDNIIKFDISSVSGNKFLTLHLGFYSLPVYIVKNETLEGTNVEFSPKSISRLILNSEKLPVYNIFTISNLGKSDLKGVYFEYNNESLSLNSSKFNLNVNESKEINFSIIKGIDFKSKILLRYGNYSLELPVSVIFEKINRTGITNESNGTTNLYRCSELRGKICSAAEVCSAAQEISLDGQCCTGECIVETQSSSGYSWLGYLIGVIVIVGLIYVYMKYKKTKTPANPLASHLGPSPSSPHSLIQKRPGMP